MRAVVLRLLAKELGGLGDFQLAIPGHEVEERVALWYGLPPPPLPRHANVASVTHEGEIDGRRAYVEGVPRGVRPSLLAPPPELSGFIVSEILVGLRFLHEAGEVHGAVGPDRILLGTRGEVVLVGRGRQGGHARIDVVSALSLMPRETETTLLEADVSRLVAQIRSQSPPGARGQLAAWVRSVVEDGRVVEEALLGMGEEADAVDEIVPDIGPDLAAGGILDRFTATSTPGITTGEVTAGEVTAAEVTSEATGESVAAPADVGASLWNVLSSPLERPLPPERFAAVRGTPSRGLRAIRDAEGLDLPGGPLIGTVGAFVLASPRFEDQPTMVGALGVSEPSVIRQKGPTARASGGGRWLQRILVLVVLAATIALALWQALG